jgi:hypothetical protein
LKLIMHFPFETTSNNRAKDKPERLAVITIAPLK